MTCYDIEETAFGQEMHARYPVPTCTFRAVHSNRS
jgi:hypothetical protein